jgi:predicted nucleic acid-binding protein
MIVLDTNVLSEAVRTSPSQAVMRWLGKQDQASVFITTITQAEMLYGVGVLPIGKRRARLQDAIESLLREEFRDRILPFDEEAARLFARIVVSREAIGRPISQFDAMIASIAASRQAQIATRNISDFEHCGVQLINPWAT